MLTLERLKLEHLKEIEMSAVEPSIVGAVKHEHMMKLVESPHNYAITYQGSVLVCGGVVEYWFGRAEAWALLSKYCSPHLLEVQRIVIDFLNKVPYRRVEASIQMGYEKGHRWVQALGFVLELGERKFFFPDGSSASLYARLK